jgi:transcription-repair coupling factor
MLLEFLSKKLSYLTNDFQLFISKGDRKYIIVKQRDFENLNFYAQLFGKILNQKVEFLGFRKGEKFRLWLNQNRGKASINIGETILKLDKDNEYSVLDITNKLTASGYDRQIRVQYPGEFSLLGDVLHVYLSGFNEILRVSFFGNVIDEISFVDEKSRKVSRTVNEIEIFENSFQNSKSELDPLKKVKSILPDAFFIGNTQAKTKQSLRFIMIEDGLPGFDLKKFDLGINPIPGGEYIVGEFEAIKRLIDIYVNKSWQVYSTIDTTEKNEISLQFESLQNMEVSTEEANLLKRGFEITDKKMAFFTPYELVAEIDLNSYANNSLINRGKIKKGDYVVHSDHGISIFDGIVEKDEKSYLLLRYAGEDRLYVPLDQIVNVTKYLGSRKGIPSLTKLNGGGWNRAKLSVRKDIEQIAKELLQLYTLRKNTKTSSKLIMEDVVIQESMKQFLSSFPYEETEDQIASTQEILLDLQKDFPMDRLLVGDVGFGKTEVAMRAVFAMACLGKQSAVLAPTTVLVEQHKAVFRKRFSQFKNLRIESISRFQSAVEQRQIIEDLELGKIDILIGTHSILSERVRFKNLGLIVIDEEQRFGVKHKEKLKLRRLDSHVLTLTATPIPRTLNLSLSGVRDISVIETPPLNRKPIKNYTGALDWNLIIQSILKERERTGQVYFLHNRVRDIESVALKIHELLPDINVDVAHGQMAVHHLTKVMREFAEGKIDVLVCTTIIENGIDLPNVNTLIVDDVEKLGLSQMYQIRGRIGRADRQAYAYFFYNNLRGNSSLRLEAMSEFHDLGVGYKLANRDMEIRGAGSILGDSQSGFIDNVGYSLYMQMLNEEISKKTGDNLVVKQSFEAVERIWMR